MTLAIKRTFNKSSTVFIPSKISVNCCLEQRIETIHSRKADKSNKKLAKRFQRSKKVNNIGISMYTQLIIEA